MSSLRGLVPDATRLIAQQHEAPESGCSFFPEPLEQWDGFASETFDYLQRARGVRDLIFKPAYLAVDCAKQFGPIPEQAVHIRNAAITGKNFLGFARLPETLYDASVSLGELCYKDPEEESSEHPISEAVLSVLDIVNPAVETAEALQASRVIQLPTETMTTLGHWNTGALLFTMTHRAFVDLFTIAEADGAMKQEKPLESAEEEGIAPLHQTQENFDVRKEMAPTVIALSLIDLAMRVSYIVLTTITLIAAFFVGAIANPAVWILAASISALVFTIIGEFASRAYNPNFPDPIKLPPIGNEGAHEDWDWPNKLPWTPRDTVSEAADEGDPLDAPALRNYKADGQAAELSVS